MIGGLQMEQKYLLNEKEFYKIVPDGRTASGRALWVNDTCVVKPKLVIDKLSEELKEEV